LSAFELPRKSGFAGIILDFALNMRDNIRDDLDNEMDMQNDPVVLKLLELFIHFTPSY